MGCLIVRIACGGGPNTDVHQLLLDQWLSRLWWYSLLTVAVVVGAAVDAALIYA